MIQNPTKHLRKRSLCTWMTGLVLLCLQWGCLNPQSLLDRYQEVSVRGLTSQTRYLSIQIRICKPGEKKPFLLERNRDVKVPLGNELFYFPELPTGRLQVLVRAYKTADRTKLVKFKDWYTQTYKRLERLPILTLESLQNQQMIAPLACVVAPPVIKPPPKREEPTQWTLRFPKQTTQVLPDSPLRILDPTRIIPPIQTTPTLPSSPFRLSDRLTVRAPITLPDVTGRKMVHNGNSLLFLHNSQQGSSSLVAVNPRTGERLHSAELPQGCYPKGLDAQGHLIAVTCSHKDRLFFFSSRTLEQKEPKQGVEVGHNPVAVKISGLFAVVVNQNSNNISVVRIDRPTEKPQTIEVGETPTDVTAVGNRFYIANSDSGSISMVDVDPSRGEARKWDSDLTVGRKPTFLTANGKFLIVSNLLDQTLTIQPLGNGLKARTIRLNSTPGRIALLSYTALVSDQNNERAFVIDLRTFKISQTLSFSKRVHSLQITGETVYASSTQGQSLMSALFDGRSGHIQLNLGSTLRQVLQYNNRTWAYDAGSKRMVVVENNDFHVATPVLWARHSNERLVWKQSHNNTIIHASPDNPNEVQIRSVSSPLHVSLALKFDQPAISAQVHGDTAYLLHSADNGSTTSPFVTRINLKEAQQGIRVQSPEMHLNFLKQPVDFLKVGDLWLIADKQTRTLVLSKTLGSQDDQHFVFMRSLSLKGTPVQLRQMGRYLVVLLEGGVIQILDLQLSVNEMKMQAPVQIGEKIGRVEVYKKFFAFTDRKQDLLIFFDPAKEKIVEKVKTGCNPDHVLFSDSHAYVSNRDDGSLSILPLSF